MGLGSFVTDVASGWRPLARFHILLVGIGATVWLVVVAVLVTTRWLAPGISVSVERSGAFVINTGSNNRTAVFLLTPNGGKATPWVDSGIEIQQGQRIKVTTSGRVCLAMHHMIESAQSDIPPPVPWNGPAGIDTASEIPPVTHRPEEFERNKFKIARDLFQGRVIGVISSREPPVYPDSASIIDIGEFYEGVAAESGTLWLTVNEIWLNRSEREAYAPRTPEEFDSLIVAKSYWNVWYDDNSGAFLVTVESGR